MVSHFETEKLAAAKAAARIIKDGDIVGIGSGSTITYFIREIGKKVATEGIDIVCVPTSIDTKLKLIECGLKIGDTDTHIPNIAFDGADQITKEGWMIKGGGAAMTRERIVAHLSERWIILVDSSKIVEKLCRAVPIEFLYFGYPVIKKKVEAIGGRFSFRTSNGKLGPVISDNGNPIGDVNFDVIHDPSSIMDVLNSVPSLIDHGLFKGASEVIIGQKDGSVERFIPKFDDR